MLSMLVLAAALQAPDTGYFQQRVAYRIEARLDESAQVLNGRLRMHYQNRSSRQLDTLWFHLHLNAFRPHSLWARHDQAHGGLRFQQLGAEAHAFERVHRVALDGRAVTPVFPLAPDSTVMAVLLRAPLLPGDSVMVGMDWDARPATLPRRQGRRGRHWDLAHWYPRIAVFDRDGWQVQPLLPQGEFYGEFAEYDVTLELADDQVVGATGVPVSGDPGWAGAAAVPGAAPDYRRDVYPARAAEALGLLAPAPAAGRKQVRWRALDVHHFAWTTSPQYRYEGGAYGDVAIHVLYQPGDTAWDDGVAVRNTVAALAWYDTIFGAFAWPQITNVHRIEGGGTEFPMMMMNGSASAGLILHEAGHNYVQGILANNEFREGWLDEGFVAFLTNLAFHTRDGQSSWRRAIDEVRRLETVRPVQPVDLPGAEFIDGELYSAMTYRKAEAIFWMLRDVMGEANLRRGLRHYYEHNRLRHVREQDLVAAMEAFHPGGLGWFFHQWLHTTGRLDYELGPVSVKRRRDAKWELRIEVLRHGDIWMPVTLLVDGARHRLESKDARQWLTLILDARPVEVVLDPDGVLLESDVTNNRRTL
ncbi:MAG TPA: M1 family metallopeptidase [Longimicrobiales bacterium]|nr:M1 family metallopeptidase [Longimicrobiales bacterium]